MAFNNISDLKSAARALRVAGEEIFGAAHSAPGSWAEFSQVIPTSSITNRVDIIAAMPQVREWVGAKQFIDARNYTHTVDLKKYEASFKINRMDLQYDATGAMRGAISRMSSFNQIYDEVVHAGLFANPTGYDSVALFSASHPHGPSGNQSNTSTTALSFAQFDAAVQAMHALKDENGRPLGVDPKVLIVGPKLRKLAMEITQSSERIISVNNTGVEASSSTVSSATIPNVFGGGMMTLVVDPRFSGTYDDYYLLLDPAKGAPILVYEGRKPELIEQTDMGDEGRFLMDEFRLSAECDIVTAAGLWQCAFMGIVS